ncbi:MAG: glycosyltransferase family 2 protein [Acidobacteriia bacterium]|nr:glycosyltransferase family 2 protein [Terriglobia bacterium]
MRLPSYVLITPARDEARFIERTIRSVVAQTVRPLRWVIVSDGSTDGMDDIVREHLPRNPWMEFLRMPERSERDFAGKVHAFNAAYARVQGLKYDAIGCLDGDVSFEQDYFAFLLRKLAEDSALGVVGTPFQDGSHPIYDYRFVSIEHVSGACQLFRRRCFEDIGGYIPVRGGGVDYIAVVTARMKGWKTRTFPHKVCHHHREIGTAQHGVLQARFRCGTKDYAMGNHPLWEVFRAAYQMTKPPPVVGGVALGCGYLWAMAHRLERTVQCGQMEFVQREQMDRLRQFFKFAKAPCPRQPLGRRTAE